jgi:hypothetical protein
MFCPTNLSPENAEISVPTKPLLHGKLVANVLSPPNWHRFWFDGIPWLGRVLSAAMNSPRYDVTLEQTADFIAEDLETVEGRWVGVPVGIIDAAK